METNTEIAQRIANTLYHTFFTEKGIQWVGEHQEEIEAAMAGIIEFELTEGGEDDPEDEETK